MFEGKIKKINEPYLNITVERDVGIQYYYYNKFGILTFNYTYDDNVYNIIIIDFNPWISLFCISLLHIK